MSPTESELVEGLLRSYLLRTLPEDQREAVDRRLLADADFFELALALESDLLADYAAGELSASEAAVVRGWLVSSAEVRARLAVIRELTGRQEMTHPAS